MERASRLLSTLGLKSVEKAGVRSYHLAPGAWAGAVGRGIAQHTKPTWFENGKLTIEVEDAVWQAQLTSLRGQILAKLEQIAGKGMIQTLEFRVIPPRRAPQRAAAAGQALADDAEAIEDPVMRRVYRSARRKAIG